MALLRSNKMLQLASLLQKSVNTLRRHDLPAWLRTCSRCLALRILPSRSSFGQLTRIRPDTPLLLVRYGDFAASLPALAD